MARAKKTETTEAHPIVAYKGFDETLTCRGFSYEFGKTYKHEGKVEACESGFHACEHPLNVFNYYPPATSRYALVELGGATAREEGGDTKIAAAEITIRAELRLPELIASAVRFVFDRAKWTGTNHATGDSEGAEDKKTRGAATASGHQGAATASGYQGAATASGHQGAATASGDRGAATASGEQGAATASGYEGKVRGKDGCALFLTERSTSGEILHAWAGIAGRDGIKPDTWYRLRDGQPVEMEQAAA